MAGHYTIAENHANTEIYVIAAHPSWRESRINRPLMEAALALPKAQIQDLYSSYPEWPEMNELEPCAACVVPLKDRPLNQAAT